MVKTRAKADLIRGLDGNQGLAIQLGTYQARYGDWRELFRERRPDREGDARTTSGAWRTRRSSRPTAPWA